jgi:hypothetical protein
MFLCVSVAGRVGEKDNFLQLSYADVKWFEERGCKWSKIVAPKVRPIKRSSSCLFKVVIMFSLKSSPLSLVWHTSNLL